jgi:hypothetical protein
MRVRLNDGRTVVKLHHFRFCAKHVALLMQLTMEAPSLELKADSNIGMPKFVLAGDLNLDHMELTFLNPADAA